MRHVILRATLDSSESPIVPAAADNRSSIIHQPDSKDNDRALYNLWFEHPMGA